MTRDEMQQLAADTLKRDRRLICQWATGAGKSNVVLKFLSDNPGMTALILVPEKNNIDNWLYEFDKFGVSTLGVTIACYASYHKFRDTQWGLLVFDEAPHINTELRLEIGESVYGDYILALGAVLSLDERLSLEMLYGKFSVSTLTLPEAIRRKYIKPPMVYVLHLMMEGKVKEQYKKISESVTKAVATYEASSSEWNRRRMLQAGSLRKRFLGEQKSEALNYLCNKLYEHKRRFICFCSSIQQAEELGKDRAFTSQSPASMNHLEKFNNHEIDSLFVVGKLIEGQNLKDIDAGIIGQLGGTERITVQEIGRIVRGDNPVIYVPVFDDTKDSSFLYTLTSNIPMEYIKHYNFKYTF